MEFLGFPVLSTLSWHIFCHFPLHCFVQAQVWPQDPKTNGHHRHRFPAPRGQLFLVPTLCQCQAVQVCHGQGRNHSRRVDDQTWWPCWWAQAAWCSRIPPDGFQGMDYEWSVQEITSIRRFRSEEHKADHRRRGLDDDAAGSCKSPMAADGCALWQESVCNKNTKTDQKMPVPTTVLSRLSCS